MLYEAKLLLSLNFDSLFLAMDRRRTPLDAADAAGVKLAMANLFNDAAPLYLAGESI